MQSSIMLLKLNAMLQALCALLVLPARILHSPAQKQPVLQGCILSLEHHAKRATRLRVVRLREALNEVVRVRQLRRLLHLRERHRVRVAYLQRKSVLSL